jgi:hypothetical protein
MGMVRWVKAVLPAMQSQKSGELVVFASLAGVDARARCKTPMLDDAMSKGMPGRLKNLSRAAAPELVIDAIEASLTGGHRGIFVFPGVPTKVLWRARRFSPTLLAKIVKHFSSAG